MFQLTDLMFFFFILLVFVVSFGVAYHANMFPQTPASWSILVNVLYFPYFQMYGELFLEDMKGGPLVPDHLSMAKICHWWELPQV